MIECMIAQSLGAGQRAEFVRDVSHVAHAERAAPATAMTAWVGLISAAAGGGTGVGATMDAMPFSAVPATPVDMPMPTFTRPSAARRACIVEEN